MNKDSPEKSFENSDDEPLIVSVLDEDGVEHYFEELTSLMHDGKDYVALLPIYDEDVTDEDGELIFLVRNQSGEDVFLEPIEDDDEYMTVGHLFEEILSDRFEFDSEG